MTWKRESSKFILTTTNCGAEKKRNGCLRLTFCLTGKHECVSSDNFVMLFQTDF